MPTPALPLNRTYRLVTRSDFDGLVCAALLQELGLLHDILFVHPKDVQDGKVELTGHDITTNLPYRPEVALSFDHHASELRRVVGERDNRVMTADADSAARVVYDYFGGAERFPGVSLEMMEAVDRADAAQLSIEDILDPQGWILLSFLMDPRTGLGRFRDFRISNYQLMMKLIDACTTMSVEEILATPDVAERVELYRAHADDALRAVRAAAGARDRIQAVADSMELRLETRMAVATGLVLGLATRTSSRPGEQPPAAKLTLRAGDHVALIGNTLADRMQHDGWLETLLHSRFPKHQLVVRNLGFSGDELTLRLRSKSFGTPD